MTASKVADGEMDGHPFGERLLARRMLAGDEAAFTLFFDSYFPPLYRFALRRVDGNADLAEELVQRTMCVAVQRIGSWRGEAQLLTWLCAICRNEVAGHFRRRHERAHVELAEELPEVRAALESLCVDAGNPEREAMRQQTRELVHVALDHLPPRYSMALEWMYLEGASMKEIAVRLGVTPKAVESLLTRSRAALRDALASVLGDGSGTVLGGARG